jgi:tRNA threonylcarbamoyladenosine biosynthesis protein TsaE
MTQELDSPEATRAAGAELARVLIADASRAPWLIGLSGELGTGKTTFVAGLLGALGHAGAVRSPTYTFIEPYRLAGRDVHHCDLYRIVAPQEIDDLGLRDLINEDAVLLVEWPTRAGGRLGDFDVMAAFEYAQSANGRRLQLSPGSPRGAALLRMRSR